MRGRSAANLDRISVAGSRNPLAARAGTPRARERGPIVPAPRLVAFTALATLGLTAFSCAIVVARNV